MSPQPASTSSRAIVWPSVITVISAAILIGAEVFGAAFAGGWALAILFGLDDTAAHILQAVLFGIGVWATSGAEYAGQFYAGWLTEYSLSVDNLFVFIVLMSALAVPRKYQQEALMVGIILALVFRAIFIAVGYTLVENFSWVFYIFGAFLIYTAFGLVRVKRAWFEGRPLAAAPEFEDCRRLALAAGAPWREVYRAALTAAEALPRR
jgi:hypothetical protein